MNSTGALLEMSMTILESRNPVLGFAEMFRVADELRRLVGLGCDGCYPCTELCLYSYFNLQYTGCNRRKGPDFGRVFLMLNYTEKPQNTYIQN